jgi:F-type H+-transporting ATPase subunit a
VKRRFAILGSVLALGLAATAFAQPPSVKGQGPQVESPPEANNQVEKPKSLPDAIFGHIADEHEMEFENPLNGKAVRAELPEIHHAFGLAWLDLSITKHLVWAWVAAVLLCLFLWIWRPRSITPKGMGVLIETLVIFVRDEIAKPTIGEPEYRRYTPYLLSCFFFILFMNLMGIIPYTSTPTGDLAVTAALAACTFFVTQFAALRSAGIKGFLKHLDGGAPIWLIWLMAPIEIFGLFTKPFALCVRLFANMMAGHIVIFFLLGMIFIFGTVLVSPVSIAIAVAMYLLEIFVALLQAYVFTMLSSLFIGMGVAMGHHGHEGHHHAEPDSHQLV